MPQLIDVPGKGVVEFPDGMSDDQIVAAIKKNSMTVSSKEAANIAAKDVGVGEALMIGMGRTADKTIQGVKQLFGKADPEAESQKDAAYSALREARPIATGIGEALPYMAVPFASIPRAAAAIGGLEALKYGTPQERLTSGVVGAGSAAVGGLLGKGVGKLIAPVRPEAQTTMRRGALEAADRIGVTPRLSQVTGSPLAARMEDFAARVPGGAGVMQSFENANKAAVNQAAAKSIGQSADELTPSVFANAEQQLGRVFEDIKSLGKVSVNGKSVNPIRLDSGVLKAADEVLRSTSKALPEQANAQLVSIAKRAKNMAGMRGRIDGEAYQAIRSGLTNASYEASGSDRVMFGKLLEALDDAADKSLRQVGRTDLADALRTVRPQYGNLKLLEKGAVAEAGNVSPARTASAMRTQNPSAFRTGAQQGNPLYDIAMVGENLKPLQAGSPTVERGIMNSPLGMLLSAGPSWAMGKATTNPFLIGYASQFGGTPAAQGTAQVMDPLLRSILMGVQPLRGDQ
jgi:hypothetical protein